MIRFLRNCFLLFMLLLIVAGGFAYVQYQEVMNAQINPNNDEVIVIKKGQGIRSIAQTLKERYGLKASWPLLLHAKLNDQVSKIKAGSYLITRNMPLQTLLQHMVEGKTAAFSIRVQEGQTFAQLRAQLASVDTLAQTIGNKTEAEIAELLGIEGALEGWFLPDTYQYDYHTSDVDFLKRLYHDMRNYLDKAWQNRAPNLPLATPYEALILASIVEKETGLASERAKVAGVFIRRLQKNMRLQTDPTVIYGASDYNGVITKTHLTTDTPYNTYTRYGLPPTPIALPSRASIDAALHPDDSENLYFVADGKGGHTFSKTYDEHLEAVKNYRRLQQK